MSRRRLLRRVCRRVGNVLGYSIFQFSVAAPLASFAIEAESVSGEPPVSTDCVVLSPAGSVSATALIVIELEAVFAVSDFEVAAIVAEQSAFRDDSAGTRYVAVVPLAVRLPQPVAGESLQLTPLLLESLLTVALKVSDDVAPALTGDDGAPLRVTAMDWVTVGELPSLQPHKKATKKTVILRWQCRVASLEDLKCVVSTTSGCFRGASQVHQPSCPLVQH